MPEEIKFRVWDREKGKMLYNPMIMDGKPYIYWLEFEDETFKYQQIYGDLMQYTGLKDRNGREIYESDIVEAFMDNEDNTRIVGRVQYSDCTWMVHYDKVMAEEFMNLSFVKFSVLGNR